jgi:acetylornithine deacetylase/succinyl-diaminopimelate desuccinylase-like protein
MTNFAKEQKLNGCSIHPLKDKDRTPFLVIIIDASEGNSSENSVLMYGHMDKQPFGEGWIHPPCDPVIEKGKLNGRGSSDDCYSFYSAILAVKACQVNNLSHPRVIITIEGNEEGGSLEDLMYYMKSYKESLIGEPNVVICLDSDAFSEETLVISSSLRGCLIFDLNVEAFKENLHSGYSGIIPDPFIIATSLVNRLIDFNSHKLIEEFMVDIPEYR